jgi:predicted ArsR family transcriptional regulator
MNLHTEAHARSTDPHTSREAAEAVRATSMEDAVLKTLAKFPEGATAIEIAYRMRTPRDNVSPRMKPLVKKGFVRDSGRVKRGDSGRNLIVWEIFPARQSLI